MLTGPGGRRSRAEAVLRELSDPLEAGNADGHARYACVSWDGVASDPWERCAHEV
jgi:hypothetical protein